MADEILLKWTVETGELKKAAAEVQNVTNLVDNMGKSVKSTFSEKAIQDATKKLYEQGDVMGALIEKYGSASSALKAMEKELQTMAVLGQRNTKEFKELAKTTAEFRDTVEDTRGEVKKMASDTRVFDTMVQGARGAAAAFSVFEGATAALGAENKDLQKTIMQVQGAMAVLTGVQELANLATEKGGIATQAYGLALKAVTAVEEAFAISSAAAWAVVTGGISLAVAGIAYLVSSFGEAETASEKLRIAEEQRQSKFYEKYQSQVKALQQLDDQNELNYSRAKRRGDDLVALEKRQLNERLGLIGELMQQTEYNFKTGAINQEAYNEIILGLEKEQEATLLKLRGDFGKTQQAQDEKLAKERLANLGRIMKEQIEAMRQADIMAEQIQPGAEPLQIITDAQIESFSGKIDEMKKVSTKGAEEASKVWADNFKEQMGKVIDYLQSAQQALSAVRNFSDAMFSQQAATLKKNEEQQLSQLDKNEQAAIKQAGDNAEQRLAIEEAYAKQRDRIQKDQARRQAELKRKQAIADKTFAAFEIAINTAMGVSKAISDQNYSGVALAIALGAVELATVLSEPLPEIPQYEKGGPVVLGGGRLDDGHLVGRSHRQGGILIEAEGGEFVVNKESAQRHADLLKAVNENRIEDMVFHRYIAPALEKMMPNKGGEFFDDLPLRNEVRNSRKSHTKDAEYIVRGITDGLANKGYYIKRYGA